MTDIPNAKPKKFSKKVLDFLVYAIFAIAWFIVGWCSCIYYYGLSSDNPPAIEKSAADKAQPEKMDQDSWLTISEINAMLDEYNKYIQSVSKEREESFVEYDKIAYAIKLIDKAEKSKKPDNYEALIEMRDSIKAVLDKYDSVLSGLAEDKKFLHSVKMKISNEGIGVNAQLIGKIEDLRIKVGFSKTPKKPIDLNELE